MRNAILLLLFALSGCGLVPRTSTGNDVMDAVLIREDPFGGCVTIGGQTKIYKDIGRPNDPPGQLTAETFQDPGARAAAAAIAISFRDFVRGDENLIHVGARNAQSCTMDLSRPVYSANYAFIDYSQPSGAIGVYVFRKDGALWSMIEHNVLGAW